MPVTLFGYVCTHAARHRPISVLELLESMRNTRPPAVRAQARCSVTGE